MDITSLIYTFYGIIFLFFVIFILTGKFILFGLKLQFARRRYKNNIGLVFYRSIGSDFNFPKIVPLDKQMLDEKKQIHVFTRDMFKEGTFWHIPFMFADVEDMKTSYGLYKQAVGADGKPLNYSINTPSVMLDKMTLTEQEKEQFAHIQTPFPVLKAIKESVTVDPALLKTAFSAAALSRALEEFLRKYMMILIIAGIAAVLAGGALFFAYNANNSISNLCVEKFGELSATVIKSMTNVTVH